MKCFEIIYKMLKYSLKQNKWNKVSTYNSQRLL